MRWIVGLDLRPSSQGALHFGRWLAERMHDAPQRSLFAVHVVEQESTFPILRYHAEEEVRLGAVTAAQRAVDAAGAQAWVGTPQVVVGTTADDRLAAVVPLYHAAGILVGRQAKAGQDRIVRLGRVARRLLRALPAPVVIVPPDLLASQIGDGPVVLATELSPASLAAARFARALATKLGRELLVAHVVPLPDNVGVVAYVPDFSWEKAGSDWHDSAVENLVRWDAENEVGADRRVVDAGLVITRLVDLAERERACMVVCGSRSLNALERVFTSSVATDLAAAARVPVAVVPPGWQAPDDTGLEE
jgi:nucleotide-binding universal stress UspA family protein